jgi:hypothetical protein
MKLLKKPVNIIYVSCDILKLIIDICIKENIINIKDNRNSDDVINSIHGVIDVCKVLMVIPLTNTKCPKKCWPF